MTKIILTDIDNTILDFESAFVPWMQDRGYIAQGSLKETFCLATHYGIEEEEILRLVRDFSDHEAFSTLAPEPHAVSALQELHQAGFQFIGITACHDSPEALQHRRANLEAVFGFEWPVIHITGILRDKREVLAQYDQAIWVEDHAHNAIHGAMMGHRTYLIAQPYNRGIWPGVTRVRDWRAIRDELISG